MEWLLDYDGLIYKIISKYPRKFDRDDLYQVGMLGLIDAYKHYNSTYGTKFLLTKALKSAKINILEKIVVLKLVKG